MREYRLPDMGNLVVIQEYVLAFVKGFTILQRDV